MLRLTSWNRMQRYYGGKGGTVETGANTAGRIQERLMNNWISAVSRRVEQYLDRGMELTYRTEYYPATYKRLIYHTKAWPISAIDVTIDSTSRYSGGQTVLTEGNEYTKNYTNDGEADGIVLNVPLTWIQHNGVKLTYTGGMASHGVNSTFTMGSDVSSFTVNYFVFGGTSGAMGIVVSASSTTLVVENIYGEFVEGETLTEYSDEIGSTATGQSAVLSSITLASMAQAYPDIVGAAEAEIRYMREHMLDFENIGTMPSGDTRRRIAGQGEQYRLQPEAMALLQPYRNMVAAGSW